MDTTLLSAAARPWRPGDLAAYDSKAIGTTSLFLFIATHRDVPDAFVFQTTRTTQIYWSKHNGLPLRPEVRKIVGRR